MIPAGLFLFLFCVFVLFFSFYLDRKELLTLKIVLMYGILSEMDRQV